MPVAMQPDGRFGRYLFKIMNDNETQARPLAAKLDSTYEHVRKMIINHVHPSPHMIEKLTRDLKGFDADHAQLLVDQDKAQKKFKNFHQMSGSNPEMDTISKEWPYLDKHDRANIITMVTALASKNRQQRPKAKAKAA